MRARREVSSTLQGAYSAYVTKRRGNTTTYCDVYVRYYQCKNAEMRARHEAPIALQGAYLAYVTKRRADTTTYCEVYKILFLKFKKQLTLLTAS